MPTVTKNMMRATLALAAPIIGSASSNAFTLKSETKSVAGSTAVAVGNKVGAPDQELPAVKTTLATWPESMESWELAALLDGLMHMSDKEADAGCTALTQYISDNQVGSDGMYECKAIVNANGQWPFAKSDIVRLARVTVDGDFEIVVVTAPKDTAEIFAAFFDSFAQNTGLYDNVISQAITQLAFAGECTADEWKEGKCSIDGKVVPYDSSMFDLLIGYSYGSSFVKDMFKNRVEGSTNSGAIDLFSTDEESKKENDAGKFGDRKYYPELSKFTRTAIFNPYLTSVVRTENPLVDVVHAVIDESLEMVVQLVPHALAWVVGLAQNAAASNPQTAALAPVIAVLGNGIVNIAKGLIAKHEAKDQADEAEMQKWIDDFQDMMKKATDKDTAGQSVKDNAKAMQEEVDGFLKRVEDAAGLSGDLKTQITNMVKTLWKYMTDGSALAELFSSIYPTRLVEGKAYTLDLNVRMSHDAASACGGSGLAINLGGMEKVECGDDGEACGPGSDLSEYDGEKVMTNADGTAFELKGATRYSLFADQNKISTIVQFLKEPANAKVYTMEKMSLEETSNKIVAVSGGTAPHTEMWDIPLSCCEVTAENTANLLNTWIDSQASAFCTDYEEKANCHAYYWDAQEKWGVERECGNDAPNNWWGQHVSGPFDCTKHRWTCKVEKWNPTIFNIKVPIGKWIGGLIDKTVCKALESEEFQDKIDATAVKFCKNPAEVLHLNTIKNVLKNGITDSIKLAEADSK